MLKLPSTSPGKDVKLHRAVARARIDMQDDLVQDAWLAQLQCKSPLRGAEDSLKRERLHARREVPFSQLQTHAAG